MYKNRYVWFAFLLGFLLNVHHISAVTVSGIGTVDTSAAMYREWWYTSENPLLRGSSSDAQVTVVIDSTSAIAAVSDGSWSYRPSTLTSGDHQVQIQDSAGTVAFMLHIGQTMPAQANSTGSPASPAQPVSGVVETTLALLIGGAGLIGLGLKLSKSK